MFILQTNRNKKLKSLAMFSSASPYSFSHHFEAILTSFNSLSHHKIFLEQKIQKKKKMDFKKKKPKKKKKWMLKHQKQP